MDDKSTTPTKKTTKRDRHKLLIYFLALTLLSLGPYILKFYPFDLSQDTQDWGAFGSYVSGVFGTLILTLTLYNLIQTKNQQNIMIDAQRNQINLQEKQSIISEVFYTTEMALKNYPILRNSMEKNHIKCGLLRIFELAQRDEICSTIARNNTKLGISFEIVLSRQGLSESNGINYISWLQDSEIHYETRANCILALMDPILSHLDLILKLSPISPYINDFIKNESSHLRRYFVCSYHFYSGYRDNVCRNLLSEKYSNIQLLEKYMQNIMPSIDYKTAEDDFWTKLGKTLADYENSTAYNY